MPAFSPALRGLAKGADGTGAGGPAKGHLSDDAGQTDDDNKEKIGQKKGASAVFGDSGGKHPYIAHAHSRADAGKDEPPIGFPGVPLSVSWVIHVKPPMFSKMNA